MTPTQQMIIQYSCPEWKSNYDTFELVVMGQRSTSISIGRHSVGHHAGFLHCMRSESMVASVIFGFCFFFPSGRVVTLASSYNRQDRSPLDHQTLVGQMPPFRKQVLYYTMLVCLSVMFVSSYLLFAAKLYCVIFFLPWLYLTTTMVWIGVATLFL